MNSSSTIGSSTVMNQMMNTGASTGWGMAYAKMTMGIDISLRTSTSASTRPRRTSNSTARINAITTEVINAPWGT